MVPIHAFYKIKWSLWSHQLLDNLNIFIIDYYVLLACNLEELQITDISISKLFGTSLLAQWFENRDPTCHLMWQRKTSFSPTNFCQQLFSISISSLRKKEGGGGRPRKRMRVEGRNWGGLQGDRLDVELCHFPGINSNHL